MSPIEQGEGKRELFGPFRHELDGSGLPWLDRANVYAGQADGEFVDHDLQLDTVATPLFPWDTGETWLFLRRLTCSHSQFAVFSLSIVDLGRARVAGSPDPPGGLEPHSLG